MKFKKKPMTDEMVLQITSMADIFTIILVFLLKSYATSAVNITPSTGMKIPEGSALATPTEALKIEVSETAVQIENKPIVRLSGFRFESDELQANSTSKKLNRALETEKERQKLISQANSTVSVDSKILIVADQRVPYETLKTVLASAAVSGFTDYKLVAVKKE